MSIAVGYISQARVVETLEGEYVGTDDTVTTDGLNASADLTASTTPPVTKYSAGRQALTAGAATVDLTSLPDANGTAAAVTLTGLKLQCVKLRNLSTNANAITIAVGASDGHTGLGSSFSMKLEPGDEFLFKGNDNSGVADIASNNKTFDLTGTGSQVLEFLFVAG